MSTNVSATFCPADVNVCDADADDYPRASASNGDGAFHRAWNAEAKPVLLRRRGQTPRQCKDIHFVIFETTASAATRERSTSTVSCRPPKLLS